MQYRRFRFNGQYLVEGSPVTATEMMVRIRRKVGDSFQTFERIVADAVAEDLFEQYDAAGSIGALDLWYSNQLNQMINILD